MGGEMLDQILREIPGASRNDRRMRLQTDGST